MEKKEVVQLLQYYQHDLMNDIQVVHGYLSMDKADIAKDKMDDFMKRLDASRKLLKINAPQTILWIMEFNNHHENMRLTYAMNDKEFNLQEIDDLVVKNCEQVIQSIYEACNRSELYDIYLQINQKNPNEVVFRFATTGELEDEKDIMSRYKKAKQNPQVETKHTKRECIIELTFYLNK